MNISENNKKQHLSNSNVCPVCKSTDIEGHKFESETSNAWQPVSCSSCESEWNAIYRLVDIEITKSN